MDNETKKQVVSNPLEHVVMCADDITSKLGVERGMLGKNNSLFIDMPYLPERNKVCEVIFKDGSKGEGRLTIARGWFNTNGVRFTNKSPISCWRYKYT